MKRLLQAAAALALACAPATAQVGVGSPAPNITGNFRRLDVQSLADLRGRVVLLEFWRTW